ncbi:MAG: tetratricopeptide repeat protein [Gemmatimonadetes bacterium]|nr:tetratricopeptide repeat protein [Gemmatimonadota bacterium]
MSAQVTARARLATVSVRMMPVVLLAALTALLAPSRVGAQEEILAQGNQLYQQGDFAGAVAAYDAVLEGGFTSAALHYNLGNAYFKNGDLGRSILEWERARALEPSDPDVLANLELARSVTADAIEPLPRFWLFTAVSWWVNLLPGGLLALLVGVAWLTTGFGLALRVLARRNEVRRFAMWTAIAGAGVVALLGTNLFVRELGIGRAERGVILVDAVPVRSAPAEQDDLTLFEIHEGTLVRIDQRTGGWAEVVLEDGKVGWVLADVMGVI